MSKAHEAGGGTPFWNNIVKKQGLDGNAQIVSTQLTHNMSLTIPNLGEYDAESLALILGEKAEKHITGLGVGAYEGAKEQLETDQQARIREIMNPKPVRPVGWFGEHEGEELAIFSNKKLNIDKPGSTVFKLRQKKSYF